MAYLAVEGSRSMYYEHRTARKNSPQTLLLIHGWAMNCRVWDGVTQAMVDAGHDVVSLDLRGCGQSDKDFCDLSVEELGSDVGKLVAELDLQSVVLSGWSLGGAVAVDASAKIRDRLAALVLTGGATPRYVQGDGWKHGGTREALDELLGAAATSRPTFMDGVARSVCHGDTPEPVVAALFNVFMQTSTAADATLRDLGNIDQRSSASEIVAPVLVMHGRQDAFVPWAVAEEQLKLFRTARLVSFDESGHAPFLEEPQKYLASLEQFMNDVAHEG